MKTRYIGLVPELYEQTESIETENCAELRVHGCHDYGHDNTCRECALHRGRVVRDGREGASDTGH